MLLPDDPAGRIATRSAGAALFEAEYTLRDNSAAFEPFFVPAPAGARFLVRAPTTHAPSPTRRFGCEIRFLDDDALRRAADDLLREASARAALEEAVFEARVLRLAEPVVHPARWVESLACDLWEAGLPVGFGPSWSPTTGGTIAVGSAGKEAELAVFARERRLDLKSASG